MGGLGRLIHHGRKVRGVLEIEMARWLAGQSGPPMAQGHGGRVWLSRVVDDGRKVMGGWVWRSSVDVGREVIGVE